MSPDHKKEDLAGRAVQAAANLARDFIAAEGELPSRDLSPERLAETLGIAISARGKALEEVADKLGRVLAHTPSAASPRFQNQLFGGRDAAATMAEMLVPLANTSMYTYKVAGAQVLVEREVLSRMLAAVPFPHGEGMFSPGGSLANMTAMLIARNRALDGVRDGGLRDQGSVVYSSTDAHYSIRKAAGILGLGRFNVRKVPADTSGSMRTVELERMIGDDLSRGLVPVFVNATVGTTVLGAIDPLTEIAEVTGAASVWLHVDGALGGSLLLSRKYRGLLDGLDRADSFTWNAHKMMGVPLSCSALLLKKRGLLTEHLGESAGYLFQADQDELNPGTRSLQCGRRNDALKLWAAWQLHGDDGYDRLLTRLVDLAHYAARIIAADPELELVSQPQTVTICFRVRGVSSARLCDFLDQNAILKIGHGTVGGESAVRLVCVNPDIDEERINAILGEIKAAARQLR